jgi:hypothetical protein
MRVTFLSIFAFLIVLTFGSVLVPGHVYGNPSSSPTQIMVANPIDGSQLFNFTTSEWTVGDTFTLNVSVNNVQDLSAWFIRLSWDPTLLDYVDLKLPSDHVFAGRSYVPAGPKFPDSSSVFYGLTILEETSFSGSGTLCQLKLKIIEAPSPGQTLQCNIVFNDLGNGTLLLDSELQDIAFTAINGQYVYSNPSTTSPPSPTQKSIIFTGIVQNVQPSAFKVKVDEVIYGTGLQSGDEINVSYDNAEANVLLGTLSVGDKVIVYGKLGTNGVDVSSRQYGIVNLKYVEAKHFEKTFSKFEEHTTPTPFNPPPVAGINFQFSFVTSAKLSTAINMIGDYYAVSRGGTPGILRITPSSSSGEYSFTISLQLSVNQFPYQWSKTWDQMLDVTLGKTTPIVFDRVAIPAIDIGVASVEVGVTPILTFTPTDIGCIIKSQAPLMFSEDNLTGDALSLHWTSDASATVPLIFTSDGATSITGDSYIIFTLKLKVKIDAKIKTIIGEQTFDLGEPTLDSVTPIWDLEPRGLELTKFNPYYLLLMKMPSKLLKATIDGLSETQDETGRIIKLLERGEHTIEVPKIVNASDTTRIVFVNWTNGNTENTLTLSITRDIECSPSYKTQFKLTIISGDYGTVNPPSGDYWLDANSSATINVTPFNGCIVNWVVDGASLNRKGLSLTAEMNSPHKVEVSFLDVTPPIAKAGQNRTVSQGENVTLDASDSTDNIGIVSYECDFGDGTTGTGKTVNHIYEKPGTYKVTLTVKDAAGNYATDSITITVQTTGIPLWIIGGIAAAIAATTAATILILRKKRK